MQSKTPLFMYTYCVQLYNLQFFCLQASEFFMFEAENISVSIGSPEVTNTITLTKGQRQTLLIPLTITAKWLLVS